MNGQLVVVVGRVIVRPVAGPDRPNAEIGGHDVWDPAAGSAASCFGLIRGPSPLIWPRLCNPSEVEEGTGDA
jgi:hypothetical protein